jgi:hypothetical protein
MGVIGVDSVGVEASAAGEARARLRPITLIVAVVR